MDSVIPRIILASASPRRKMLLEQLGLTFEIIVSELAEEVEASFTPEQAAEQLAFRKAQAVAASLSAGIVIGADTIVVDPQGMLGKPKDAAEAYAMLARLSGQVHRVITGVAVIAKRAPGSALVKHETTQVKIAPLSAADIHWYIRTGEPLDKAGAYGIQGQGTMFVEWIQGCYNNVVGLPLFLLVQMLRELNCDWRR